MQNFLELVSVIRNYVPEQVARKLFGAQLWSKPLPQGRVAILVVNLAPQTQEDFVLPLADVPALKCGAQCTVRDVWAQKYLALQAKELSMTLREHESGFFILGPKAAAIINDAL